MSLGRIGPRNLQVSRVAREAKRGLGRMVAMPCSTRNGSAWKRLRHIHLSHIEFREIFRYLRSALGQYLCWLTLSSRQTAEIDEVSNCVTLVTPSATAGTR